MIKKTYSQRLKSMKERRTDIDFIIKKSVTENFSYASYLTENYEGLKENDVYKYFIGSMEGVDKIYTNNTYKEAERVKNQLDKIKDNDLDFIYEYQGSVSNNTHIKAYSDIDILVLIEKFFTVEYPQVPKYPYRGDPVEDLMELRMKCEKHLTEAFYAANVDCTGAKSIGLSGGSLKRKIDVVPSNWINTNEYSRSLNKVYRGVQVLDKYKRIRIKNTPFYHNYLLNEKDKACSFNYKKIIRLLKTLKADADNKVDFNSYDIAAIVYSMDNLKFLVSDKQLLLLKNIKEHIDYILENSIYRENLYVPDRSRKIFDDSSKIAGLKKLKTEIDTLYYDIIDDLSRNRILLEKKAFAV
ncbi:hypothetical protein [Clostridium estertheticum]|uniref:hypothetical protein n=1 Tax=Clostridium estertheticum TaxID=238834 RepID=UPI001CF4B311|nr:hypothetical protein [Clostridium estertheticum]MCB2361963.1 hypothetical protein [Clostridium estertheticum]